MMTSTYAPDLVVLRDGLVVRRAAGDLLVPTAETFALLKSYYLCPERKAFTKWRSRERTRSHKIRRGSGSGVDFGDPESERVLDAIADALLGPLAIQAALDHEETEWLTSQQGCL